MSSEKLLAGEYEQVARSSSYMNWTSEQTGIFEQLPKAKIVSVSKPDASDFSPLLLSYTIQLQYKQFTWHLTKKASQVIYLHFALKKRAIVEELHEKQEQVKEWLQNMGIAEQTAVVHDDDEPEDGAVPVCTEDNAKSRYVPSRAALPIIRPSLGRQQTIAEKAKVAMQGYLNHFLGNMEIVNSREVCKFLEVSKLSFLQEYGPKLKEDYVMVKHLPKISRTNAETNGCLCCWSCFNNKWQKVWAVLKPGFFALLEDPNNPKLLDIIIFDMLPTSTGNGKGQEYLAERVKERNPLRYAFQVSSGNRSMKLRAGSHAKIKDWVSAINNVGFKLPEGWCHPHRFGSFAPSRGLTDDGSQAQWFIDGQTAFEAIASAIENANSEIYITGWWVCPELYLRRPFHSHASSRLDALLEAKAKLGVKIYILLYKEVPLALKINSSYSMRKLLRIHENIKVLRYPDHLATGIYLWSHHDKIVIVDNKICFIGGLDLCFGRYDTFEHKVGDCPVHTWPGKDYYNPRESEPNSWEDVMKDELDREKYHRMPWHDVHCALWGPPCRDVARHFVQRWNHAKNNKASNEQAIPLLMPQQHMVLPHYMGQSRNIDIESQGNEVKHKDISTDESFSFPSESIPLLLPQEANQVESESIHSNLNGFQCTGIDYIEIDSKDQTCNMIMEDGEFPISDDWLNVQELSYQVASANDAAQVGPKTKCHCQVVRSVSQWSAGTSQTEDSIHRAYCSLIEQAEHFVYIENQFFISGLSGDEIIQNRVLEAIYRRIIKADKEEKAFRVIIVMPLLPGFQGGLDDGGAATVRALTHWQYRTISRGKDSILYKLNALLGSKTDDYISFYGLRTHGKLCDSGSVVTSQVYVHSKLMIIDDRAALIGSSNINDRSLLGSRDSEIGVLIEDEDWVESSMNGKPWRAGKFAYSLRISLWLEHLGLNPSEVNLIRDPVVDTTYKDLWSAIAKQNTKIYHDVFSCIPNDSIHSRSALRQNVSHWKEKLGLTTIDLGVAPERLEITENEETKVIDTMEKLKLTKGFLVSFPLEFMCQEDLRPVFLESEFYAFPQVFY
ncbi:phospholipase D zeta 1-like [Apium graveolens]|uniref:phospholipase D zeta 1-like n=1 Tax=Apium graveolens TaxID=4045 RepID=UPI003D791C77